MTISVARVSSLDQGYLPGDLSLFPDTLDDKDSLYEVANNAESILKQGLPFLGNHIVVEDASSFPSKGMLRIGPGSGSAGNYELIYYDNRTGTVFKNLIRGFSGSTQYRWSAGVTVSNAVMAEHHNAEKDALLNIESKVGTTDSTVSGTLSKKIHDLEVKYLSPKAQFRAFPLKGVPPLKVSFQNFSCGHVVRYLWDFGDGTTSIERSPSHTYQTEGLFTVKLNVITSSGGQGVVTKSNYITVSEEQIQPFFYVVQNDTTSPAYSISTATSLGATAATFNFIDQTDGDILQRYWVFGDGEYEAVTDPNNHTTTHQYASPGEYEPSLIVIFSDENLKRSFLQETLVIL
jgi:PKD repeat protein